MRKFTYDFVELDKKNEMMDFISSLDTIDKAKVFVSINKLIEILNNNLQPKPSLSKNLRNGIFELKVNLKNRTSRSLYFFNSGQMIIFTHSFIKKTIKTPSGEIDKAISIRKRYLEIIND